MTQICGADQQVVGLLCGDDLCLRACQGGFRLLPVAETNENLPLADVVTVTSVG